jgi:hypothetical protein
MMTRKFEPGDCVILNDVEQPCARLIGVVVSVDDGYVKTKYLNADESFSSYNRRGCLSRRAVVTHLEDFGVRLRVTGVSYWCEVVGESTATYEDGKPRKWQEPKVRIHYARQNVLRLVKREEVTVG